MRVLFIFYSFSFIYIFLLPLLHLTYAQYPTPPIGAFSSASCSALSGWACDPNGYSQPLTVQIWKDGPWGGGGIYLTSVLANSANATSASYCGGFSNHGFSYTVPDSLIDAVNHQIYIYAQDYPLGYINNPLNGSPRTINCSMDIYGSAFSDLNLNQVKDPGEPNVAGGTVSTSPVSTISYPATGQYHADTLPAGTYNVYLNVPSGYQPYYPNNNGNQPFHTVAVGNSCSTDTPHGSSCSGGNILALNFALRQVFTINGAVYKDTNKNGIRDTGEGGYTGATVSLTGSANSQTTSGAAGAYTFSNLYAGAYTVTVTLPDGYFHTTASGVSVSVGPNGTVNFGISNATVTPLCNSSYDYNGTTVPSVWRPANGTWYINSQNPVGTAFGQYGDIPVPGDYDGNGTTNFAIFRNGLWYVDIYGGNPFTFGTAGDIPVPGDYDGDGLSDYAVWRPATGYWYINTSPNQSVWWGQKGDIPVPADYDGDGKTDIAVWRPVGGVWFIKQSTNGDRSEQYGEATTDMPVSGDYDGDGKADLALFKGAGPSGYNWLIRPSSGAPQILASYGGAGDTPTPGDFNGDGTTDIAVWRYSTSRWYIRGINDAGIPWGQAGDIPVACSNPTNTTTISGNVSVDHNADGTISVGEPGYNGATITLSLLGVTVGTTTTNASGNYTFSNLHPKGPTTYRVTITNPGNFEVSPASTYRDVTVVPNQTANFQLIPLYRISGNVFDDRSKDGTKNGVEANMSGDYTIQITGPVNQTVTATNGVYTSGIALYEGTYTISYESAVPAEYKMTYPLNGPPPSFSVTVGRSCTTNGANGASCSTAGFPFTASNIQNLNFGMSNNTPWFQCIGANCRIESGFTNPIPSTAGNTCSITTPGPYAAIPGTSTTTPGILYSGDGSFDFGTGGGSASPNPYNWQVGGNTPPYSQSFAQQVSRTSYSYMATTLRQSNLTPTDISTVNGCGGSGNGSLSNCTLPASLASGIYIANSDLHINAYTFGSNKSVIILVNGDLYVDGEIAVPVGSSATFSVSGDIIIDRSIGETDVCSQACNVDGFFSADGSFIIDGFNSCTNYATDLSTRDKRFNLCGAIITNGGGTGGSIQNERDLCDNDRIAPSFSVIFRPDFLLNVPEFIKFKSDVWREIAP